MYRNTEINVVRADLAIPNSTVLASTGIECDLEEARDMLVILSRVFAYGDSKERPNVYAGMSLIWRAVSCEATTDDDALPALLPPLPAAVPQGTTALRAIGVNAHEVVRLWELRPKAILCAFPLEMMTKVLPPRAWPYLAQFLAVGPSEAQARLDEAIRQRTSELTVNTLLNTISSTWLLMRVMAEFAEEVRTSNEVRLRTGRPLLEVSPALRRWTFLPTAPSRRTLVKMGASTVPRDTSAVPVAAIRVALKERARMAEWGRWDPENWPVGANWRALKRLVTLVLLVTVSPRVDHLLMLDVDDFAWHRFADGEEAWGLRFRGEAMKMRDAGEVNWKKLPLEAGGIVRAWIRCSGRELGQSGAPLLTSRRSPEGEPGIRYARGSLVNFVSGADNGKGRAHGFPEGVSPLIAFEDSQWYGYQSHRYRSFVTQHVESLIHAWRNVNPAHPLTGVEPKAFAELLVDHRVSDMGYRDFKYQPRYEQIVGLGIALIWESVWGDGAKRKGADLDRISGARDTVELLQAEVRAVEHTVQEGEHLKDVLKSEQSVLMTKARKAAGELRENLRLDADLVQNRIEGVNDEITRALRTEINLKTRLADAQAEFDHAKLAQVVLADDLPEDVYQQQLAVALGEAKDTTIAWQAPMSYELAPGDIAELYDVDPQTVWRWRTGRGRLPNPPPFNPTDWVKHDQKDYRLPVAAINMAAVPAADPEAAIAALRRKRATLGFAKQLNAKLGGVPRVVQRRRAETGHE
jgi:hypothetical protein